MTAILLAVVLGFVLGRVPTGELSLRRFKQWRTSRRYARWNARCARGDHVDLTDPDLNGDRWCAWCERMVGKDERPIAVNPLAGMWE